jgi:hypothetical protein
MKPIGIISTAALLLLLGFPATANAQQDDHKDKPAQEQQAKPEQQQHTQEAKPAPQQHAEQQTPQAKPATQERTPQAQQNKPVQQQNAQHTQPTTPAKQDHTQQAKSQDKQQAKPVAQQHVQQAKPATQQHTQQAQQAKPVQQQHVQQAQVAKPVQQQHAQRTVGEQERQRAVPALRLSVRGNARIPDDRFRANFGAGHRFVINAPIMVGGFSRFQYGGFWFGFDQPWPLGWYYTDDVYVDYIDGGYYLYNPYYPGARVAINVVL